MHNRIILIVTVLICVGTVQAQKASEIYRQMALVVDDHRQYLMHNPSLVQTLHADKRITKAADELLSLRGSIEGLANDAADIEQSADAATLANYQEIAKRDACDEIIHAPNGNLFAVMNEIADFSRASWIKAQAKYGAKYPKMLTDGGPPSMRFQLRYWKDRSELEQMAGCDVR